MSFSLLLLTLLLGCGDSNTSSLEKGPIAQRLVDSTTWPEDTILIAVEHGGPIPQRILTIEHDTVEYYYYSPIYYYPNPPKSDPIWGRIDGGIAVAPHDKLRAFVKTWWGESKDAISTSRDRTPVVADQGVWIVRLINKNGGDVETQSFLVGLYDVLLNEIDEERTTAASQLEQICDQLHRQSIDNKSMTHQQKAFTYEDFHSRLISYNTQNRR